MLAATSSPHQAGGLSHQFCSQFIWVSTVCQKVTVAAMIAEYHIISVDNRKYSRGIRLLTNIGVSSAINSPKDEFLQQAFLKSSNE